MDLGKVAASGSDGTGFPAEADKTAADVEIFSQAIAFSDRQLDKPDPLPRTGIVQGGIDEQASEAELPERFADVHPEKACLVPGFFPRFKIKPDDAGQPVFDENSEDNFLWPIAFGQP